jgi:signal transduction histidine kinase
LFGDRDEPYAVLTRLGHHIEDTLSSADLLPQIVRTTAEALRLPYAALFLERADGPVLVASSGVATTSTLRLPLMYQGQSVGALEVATRTPGEVFGQSDRRLLEDLARQIGVAARTVSLATDLQQSRERIVTSREEERRRLRRDLHDGLGAQLAALIMQAGAARSLIRTDPDAADREIVVLREELRSAVADIRRLVLGLRPPALDELGLAGALQARLARFDRGGIDAESPGLKVEFKADAPLPLLSAAAEVAAYRIVEEAVTNVVKHAEASCVTVKLQLAGESLHISVIDDGVGITSKADSTGMGLQSIRERATELGGTCEVSPVPDGKGARVEVLLPVAPKREEQPL